MNCFRRKGTGERNHPQGVIGIELSLINASLDSFYDSSNIQTASLEPLAVDPTQVADARDCSFP